MTPEIKALIEAAWATYNSPAAWPLADTLRTNLYRALEPFEPKKQVHRLAWVKYPHPRLRVVPQDLIQGFPNRTSFLQWEGAAFTVEVPE
jgi:hypothetical protein